MNIIVLSGSPRKKDSYRIIKKIQSQMENDYNATFEYININKCSVNECVGCMQCFQKGEQFCPLKDDVEMIRNKLKSADGIIFASPVYAMGITGTMKKLVDRMSYMFHRPELIAKPAITVVTTIKNNGMNSEKLEGECHMKIDRLVSIIMILLEKERIGAQELADMFEVSPRTIYRDIDTINMAGIPICSTPGVGGGFEIMQEYKVDKKVFSTADLSAILMGLSNLSNVIRGDELVNALAKVKSFIPADRANDIELKVNQIHIDLSPWIGNRNIQPYLEIIKTAMQERKLLSFEYADRYGNRTVRTAEPYQLVLKNSHWYIQGFCLKRNDFRLFKISRISNLLLLKEVFTPREYQKPQLDIEELLEGLQTKIKIRIHKSVMDRVLDYCTYEHFMPDGDEHYIVDFPFIENDFYYNILSSFSDKCECLEPKYVRAEMKHRIHDIAALYKN